MYSVAIDGPSGSGKSTVAKELANRLGITYVDTGAMYRALALKSLNTNSDFGELIENTDIDYRDGKIYLDGCDVSDQIRTEEISILASDISKNESIRQFLVDIQVKIAKKRSVVMEGRDITTVVLPDADYKFFLTGDVDIRAKRRHRQLLEKGIDADFFDVKEDLEKRDFNDTNREHSPLKIADDAIVIDSTSLSLEETIQTMLEVINA